MRRIVSAVVLLGVLLVNNSQAAVPQYNISLDTQLPAKQWEINPVYAGATPLIRANLSTNGGAWKPSADWGSFLWYGTNQYWSSTTTVHIAGTMSTNNAYIDFQATNSTFATEGRYFGGVVMTNSALQYIEWGLGEIIVATSGGIGSPADLMTTGSIYALHVSDTDNPHETTATQLGALTNAVNGGTSTAGVSVASGTVTVTFPAGSSGDITAVVAGTGITGGAVSGVATVTLENAYVQSLISNNIAVAANTAKVGYLDSLVNANVSVASNTAKVGYLETLVNANVSVASNTLKVGYLDTLVNANVSVASNTAKTGYSEALVNANVSVASNTLKVGYLETLVNANVSVASNTAKVGYLDTLVNANVSVASNTAKTGYTEALVSANVSVASNTAKVTYSDAGNVMLKDGTVAMTGNLNMGGNTITNVDYLTFVTNTMLMAGGVLNGTNGVFWTVGGSNYWVLFSE